MNRWETFVFGVIAGVIAVLTLHPDTGTRWYVCSVPNMRPDIVVVRDAELERNAPMVFVQTQVKGGRTLWIHRNQLELCEERISD